MGFLVRRTRLLFYILCCGIGTLIHKSVPQERAEEEKYKKIDHFRPQCTVFRHSLYGSMAVESGPSHTLLWVLGRQGKLVYAIRSRQANSHLYVCFRRMVLRNSSFAPLGLVHEARS